MKKIRFRVKEMLEKRGYTQRGFAEASGIQYRIVGLLSTNKIKAPSLESLEICCEVLRCKLEDIMVMEEVEGKREYKTVIVPRYDHKGKRIDD